MTRESTERVRIQQGSDFVAHGFSASWTTVLLRGPPQRSTSTLQGQISYSRCMAPASIEIEHSPPVIRACLLLSSPSRRLLSVQVNNYQKATGRDQPQLPTNHTHTSSGTWNEASLSLSLRRPIKRTSSTPPFKNLVRAHRLSEFRLCSPITQWQQVG